MESTNVDVDNLTVGNLEVDITTQHRQKQGCQMAYFKTRNIDLGKFWRVLKWKMWL
jgi:hypothetical protein